MVATASFVSPLRYSRDRKQPLRERLAVDLPGTGPERLALEPDTHWQLVFRYPAGKPGAQTVLRALEAGRHRDGGPDRLEAQWVREREDYAVLDRRVDPSIVATDPIKNIELKPSMSFGLTITYYKFPLYEALEMSRNKLFNDAKKYHTAKSGNQKIKNTIAWRFQKGSGSSVNGVFSYKEQTLVHAFNTIQKSIDNQINSNMVSAVTHKIKSNETLLKIIFEDQNSAERLNAFFDAILDYKNKKGSEKKYLDGVKILLTELYESSNDVKKVVENAYSILRTIKFIKGLEEDKDE